MNASTKVAHGTTAWFDMVGAVMEQAAIQAKLPDDFNVTLVERYIDGPHIAPGLIQGLRFRIVEGTPSFTVGARPDEQGDITIEVTTAASRTLNTLYGDDPDFHTAFAELQRRGELKVAGDLSRLGSWFGVVHDRIVDRTS